MIVSTTDPGTNSGGWITPAEIARGIADYYLRLSAIWQIQALPANALDEMLEELVSIYKFYEGKP